MFAAALYRAMGLKGYEVEDTWEGKNGALFVLVSVPPESLRYRSCRCRRVPLHDDLAPCRRATGRSGLAHRLAQTSFGRSG